MAKQRLLSEFMAREMLFDYLANSISEADRASFEMALKEFPNLSDELRQLKGAIEYCNTIRNVEVSPQVFEEANNEENLIKVILKWYREAPMTIQYGVPTVFVLILALASLRMIWKNLDLIESTRKITLARLLPDENVNHEAPITKTDTEVAAVSPAPVATPTIFGPMPNPNVVKVTPIPSLAPTLAVTPVVAVVTPKIAPSGMPIISPRPTLVAADAGGRRGFVYRAFMFSNQITAVAPAITEKIKELGGDKAGEVDLGWKRKGGRYFHFWIPETSYDAFMIYIRAQGPVRIQKDPHQRVMPSGQIRFILWVEDTVEGTAPKDGSQIQGPETEEGEEVPP